MSTALSKTSELKRRIEQAKTPAEAKRNEVDAAVYKTIAKEQGKYEDIVEGERAYILARRKTTELVKPYIQRGRPNKGNDPVTFLKDIGFTKMEWSRRVQELSIPEETIDAYFDDCIQKVVEPSTYGLRGYAVVPAVNRAKRTNGQHPAGITLIHDDMLNAIPSLGKFDMVLADPPYNVSDWEWDKLGTLKSFMADTRCWLTAIKDSLQPEYNLFWFCSPLFSADIEMELRALKFPIQSRIVWHRRNMAMGSKAKNRFVDSWEMIFHCGTRQLNFPDEWSDAWFDVQTFAVPQTNFDDTKLHPTQKPLALIKRMIEFGSWEGDRILDPFAGSGTTGEAASGRNVVLIERDAEYIGIIEHRLGVQCQGLQESIL